MGCGLYFHADSFGHIPLSVTAHIAEMPAAVRHPDTLRVRRGYLPQIYNALFWARGDGLERAAPDRALSLAELGAGLKDLPGRKIVVGDGAQLCYNALSEEVPGMVLAPLHLRAQSAWGVARAAERLGEAGGLVPAGDLVPVYLRLSQAERERLERERHTKYTIEGDHSHV